LSIEKTLFAAADKMRGSMDAGEYKHIGLGLIFLRQVSVLRLHDELTADPWSDAEDRDAYRTRSTFWGPGFWGPEKARWSTLMARAKSPDIGIHTVGPHPAREPDVLEIDREPGA
jgi:type I restriction enzyme M protein